jgi:hypothetical protein
MNERAETRPAELSPGSMLHSLLELLQGRPGDRVVWTADLSYWLTARRHDGSAEPGWDRETGYLELHRDLGVMPYYYYEKFWVGEAVFDSGVELTSTTDDGRAVTELRTPRGTLRGESVFLPESCCWGAVKHMVATAEDLDVLLWALERRRLVPAHLEDYPARRELWARYDGLPCLGLPRSPLPAFTYEWAGLENTVLLMMDYPDKVGRALELMEQQEEPVLDAVCRASPPLVHFPDNLSSENFAGYYDGHMRDRHVRRLERLHAAGVRAAVHLDGTVRGLLPKLVSAGFDAVEALTPRPAGDLTVAEIDELAGDDDVILWGGVPGAMFAPPYTPEQMAGQVRDVLDAWGGRPFVLGVADQVPPDGRIEFCRDIAEMLGDA